jgi:hypothetical protein
MATTRLSGDRHEVRTDFWQRNDAAVAPWPTLHWLIHYRGRRHFFIFFPRQMGIQKKIQ